MSLFQKSVENKYLSELDSVLIDKKYKKFQDYFGNPSIQENIRNSKEEQFQEGFLRELFVSIFGYTLNPQPNFNLTTELKNIANSKKADGAILKGEDAIAVIELKGTETTDLDKIEIQAFGYKNHNPKCVYVITSNFEKLRFYIQNAVDHIDFDLFNLTREQFSLMWLCLAKANLLNGLPQKIKESSLLQEENITKKLYADYSKFREAIYNNLVKNNPETDKLLLFKKTQKLLDRFLFIFFAEDRLLLPPNSISEIVKQWTTLKDELDEYVPLYDRFKKYFGYMNTGYKGKKYDIYAYNGGLFAPDEILDNISIDDEILHKHTLTLSQYDFETDVDVNILGHIFEHSLGEIENVQAEIKGEKIDTQKTKRKKDGIFYTPKYITKYIVENTIGKLCEEKRTELDIVDEEYAKGRKNRKKDTIKTLDDKLTDYRNWLLSLTILDPACGSGAFLNQALDFLITEHRKIDDLRAQLFGSGLVFSDITTDILEKNIYGVDLNEESVEIAKLSLWLRTAQKGRKLNKLNNNIKCGNSLIDDPEIAGEKAFNWQNEFPEIFAKGGFDVVIGNPPYVRQELVKEYTIALQSYDVFSGKADLYTFFYEKGHKLLKPNGFLSFISSGKFFEASYGKNLVNYLVKNFRIEEVINFDDLEVFKGISAYPLIFTGRNNIDTSDYAFHYCFVPEHDFLSLNEIVVNLPFSKIYIKDFEKNEFSFYTREIANLFGKLNSNSIYLKDLGCLPLVGVKTGFNEGFTNNLQLTLNKPYIFGKNLKKYQNAISDINIVFPYKRENNEYQLLVENDLGDSRNFLEENKIGLGKRAIICDGIKNGTKKWYEYQQINRKLDFDKEYIVYPNVSLGANFTLSMGNVIDMTGFIIPSNDKYLLSILNSRVCEFVMRKTAITRRGGYQEYKVQYLEKIPFKEVKQVDKIELSKLVEKIFELNSSQNQIIKTFHNLLIQKYCIDKFSKKIQTWFEIEFGEFLNELKKLKIQFSLSEEAEWLDFFNQQKEKVNNSQKQIDLVEVEINKKVYEIYGLSEDDIKILEESV